MPLVSIIMGVYNGTETIDACIRSIINQTFQEWEFIICDDCSTDDTYRKLNDWAEKDSRIIILHNDENKRLAYSLNECLKISKGKYVARMDADDESLPERLNIQVKYLENHPDVDCVGCARIIFDENGDRTVRSEKEYPERSDLLKSTPFAHPTIMMKSTVYRELGGYSVAKETMRAEDLDLWFRFFEKDYKGYNIQTPLYKYREESNDFKKRTLRAGIQTSKVYYKGYTRLGFKWYKKILAVKPIITALIPPMLIKKYHQS